MKSLKYAALIWAMAAPLAAQSQTDWLDTNIISAQDTLYANLDSATYIPANSYTVAAKFPFYAETQEMMLDWKHCLVMSLWDNIGYQYALREDWASLDDVLVVSIEQGEQLLSSREVVFMQWDYGTYAKLWYPELPMWAVWTYMINQIIPVLPTWANGEPEIWVRMQLFRNGGIDSTTVFENWGVRIEWNTFNPEFDPNN